MEDDTDTAAGFAAGFKVSDVAFDQVHGPLDLGQIPAVSGGEIVQDADASPVLDEGIHKVGSDEAAPPSDEDADACEIGDGHPGQALTTGKARVPAGKRLRVSTTSWTDA